MPSCSCTLSLSQCEIYRCMILVLVNNIGLTKNLHIGHRYNVYQYIRPVYLWLVEHFIVYYLSSKNQYGDYLKSQIPVQWDLDCVYSTVCRIFFVMINFHELAINLIIPN